jgi:hypothetical protein
MTYTLGIWTRLGRGVLLRRRKSVSEWIVNMKRKGRRLLRRNVAGSFICIGKILTTF